MPSEVAPREIELHLRVCVAVFGGALVNRKADQHPEPMIGRFVGRCVDGRFARRADAGASGAGRVRAGSAEAGSLTMNGRAGGDRESVPRGGDCGSEGAAAGARWCQVRPRGEVSGAANRSIL